MRKSIFACIALVISATTAMAQAPEAFSYSGIARNNGQVVSNTTIGLQLSILQGTPTGTAVYTETQSATTDTAGYFSVSVGMGVSTDTFSNIDWANGNHYLKVGMDTSGGNNYTDIGTTQLLSVPYALYAKNAGKPSNLYDQIFLATDSTTISDDTAHLSVPKRILRMKSFSNGKVWFDFPLSGTIGNTDGYVFNIVGNQLVFDFAHYVSSMYQLISYDMVILPNNTIQLNSIVITQTNPQTGSIATHRFRTYNP